MPARLADRGSAWSVKETLGKERSAEEACVGLKPEEKFSSFPVGMPQKEETSPGRRFQKAVHQVVQGGGITGKLCCCSLSLRRQPTKILGKGRGHPEPSNQLSIGPDLCFSRMAGLKPPASQLWSQRPWQLKMLSKRAKNSTHPGSDLLQKPQMRRCARVVCSLQTTQTFTLPGAVLLWPLPSAKFRLPQHR